MGAALRAALTAPLATPDGTLAARDHGTPQGPAVSPVLANLFMHYAFDIWITRQFPGVPFERYADDVVVHCGIQQQAHTIRATIEDRMVEVGLPLHPARPRIAYCQDSNRRGSYEHTSFTFLGYTFRARKARNRHGISFTSFLRAISTHALNKVSRAVRSWRLHRRTTFTFPSWPRRIHRTR
jgi:RNA-directed DNA polymerase